MQEAATQGGLDNQEWRGWLFPAYLLEPDETTTSFLRNRSPYTNATTFYSILTQYHQRGYLLQENDNQYRLSSKGNAAITAMLDAMWQSYDRIPNLPSASVQKLGNYLSRILNACHSAAEPQNKWCINHNRGLLDPQALSPISRIDLYLSDLSAWRDDCHLAAWQPYHYIQGYVWEVFTIVWQGKIRTLDEICERLCGRRGYSRDQYRGAIEELKIRGWLEEQDHEYHLTSAGTKIRQSAEDFTDELFYQPFGTLSEAELGELEEVIKDIIRAVRQFLQV